MRLMLCDNCGGRILMGCDYIKLVRITHLDKRIENTGAGHICLDCHKTFNKVEK